MSKSKHHKVSIEMNITTRSIKSSKLFIAGAKIFPAVTRLFYLSRNNATNCICLS